MDKKRKIAIVYPNMAVGGAERALINMLHYFDYNRYDVSLWLHDTDGEMQAQLDSRVKVINMHEMQEKSYFDFIKELLKQGRVISACKSACYRVISRINVNSFEKNLYWALKSHFIKIDEQYDVAICYHAAYNIGELKIVRCCLRAKKRIGWIHNDITTSFNKKMDEQFLPEYRLLNQIVCVSEALRTAFNTHFPELKHKTSVIYNLLNLYEIREKASQTIECPDDQLIFATVGRLHFKKGQDMIPHIARELLDRGYQFRWYIVGDGPNRESVEKAIRECRVEETVVLTGMKENPYPYIKNCSIYVQTSFTEAFCLTTFEAKILKRPVVTTDLPVMREQFSDHEAVFCEATVPALVEGICIAIKRLESGDFITEEVTENHNQRELQKVYELIG